MKYRFDHWEDGSTNPSRVIDVKANMEVTAYYKEVSEGMGKVTFTGSVSAQEKEGEVVTITVTKPDNTTDTVTTPTKADLTFGPVDYENVVGDYKAKARIEADALYQAAESVEVPFSIGKEPRTIILTVV
jgi:hypothetical protein